MVFTVALLILLSLDFPVFVQANPELNVNLRISSSWGGSDILNLDILDLDTEQRQQIAIRLSEFIGEDENVPYILLQAMDLLGERQSGVIQIENPLFDPNQVTTEATVDKSGSSVDVNELPDNLQNIVAEVNQPPSTLTPDGTGTVVDNIMTVNDIEFFTVTTDNGSDFFLVIDRQRANNNVYLLNTVTEADLAALADARGEILLPSSSNVGSVQPPVTQEMPTLEEIMQAIQEANGQNQAGYQAHPQQGSSSGIVLLIGIIVLLGGGSIAAWRFMPKLLEKMNQVKQGDEGEPEEYNEHEYGDDDDDDAVVIGFHEDFDPKDIQIEVDEKGEDNEEQDGDSYD